MKRAILGEIDAHAAPDAVIATSTSGLRPTELQRDLTHPERLVVGHPFNPVYLLPARGNLRRRADRAVQHSTTAPASTRRSR